MAGVNSNYVVDSEGVMGSDVNTTMNAAQAPTSPSVQPSSVQDRAAVAGACDCDNVSLVRGRSGTSDDIGPL